VSPQTTHNSCCPVASVRSLPAIEFGLTIADTSPQELEAVDKDSELPTLLESGKKYFVYLGFFKDCYAETISIEIIFIFKCNISPF
jgi:hypothetical protein